MSNENIVIDGKGITIILSASSVTGKSNTFFIIPNKKTFQATVRGTGNITAVVNILASLSPQIETFFILKTLSLSGVNIDSEGFITDTPWKYFVIDVLSITGTNVNIDVLVGI